MNPSHSTEYYHALYAGKKILVKASGELLSAGFYEQLGNLVRAGVHFILVAGGGRPITDTWESHIHQWNAQHPGDAPRSKARPMESGVGVTSAELMEHAVLPVHAATKLQMGLRLPDFHVVETSQLHCARQADLGFVGDPRHIDGLENAANIAVLSVGVDETGAAVNVNADGIARRIVEQMREKIDEVIFLTGTGGVLDEEGDLAPVIFSHDIRKDGTHRFLPISGGMQKKLTEIAEILPLVGKVIMTRDLQREIESVFGSGTMFVDSSQVQCSALQKNEESVFDDVCEQNVIAKKFRPRSQEQLRRLKQHHRVMRIKGSLLGGFSLMPGDEGWMELSTLWAAYLGNGMGSMLASHAKRDFMAQNKCNVLYALSTPASDGVVDHQKIIHRFVSYGFGCAGLLQGAKVSLHEALPSELLNYDTSQRNPYLFILRQAWGLGECLTEFQFQH